MKSDTQQAYMSAEETGKSPHMMTFCDPQGNTLQLQLCSFCRYLPEASGEGPCVHQHALREDQCQAFAAVEDVSARIHLLIREKAGVSDVKIELQ